MRTLRQLKLVLVIAFMIVAGAIILVSCESKRYQYQITKTVQTKSGEHAAIWYTNTFDIDSVNLNMTILNSNGTTWIIAPPYTITELKK